MDPQGLSQADQVAQALIHQRPNGFYCKKYFIGIFSAIGIAMYAMSMLILPVIITKYNMNPKVYWLEMIIILGLAIAITGTYGALFEHLPSMKVYFAVCILQCFLNGLLTLAIILIAAPSFSLITGTVVQCAWTYLVYKYINDLKTVKEEQQVVRMIFKA